VPKSACILDDPTVGGPVRSASIDTVPPAIGVKSGSGSSPLGSVPGAKPTIPPVNESNPVLGSNDVLPPANCEFQNTWGDPANTGVIGCAKRRVEQIAQLKAIIAQINVMCRNDLPKKLFIIFFLTFFLFLLC
jgi:hypothetical protein